MSNSGKYYGLKRENKRLSFFKAYTNNDNVTNEMLDIIEKKITETQPISILDLGTGNGYLIREVLRRNKNALKSSTLIGIDSSSVMIEIANNYLDAEAIEFIEMDNNRTKFQNDYFDIIIAKAVSNISTTEVYRILKTGGWFIYKEYGPGRGIVEIMTSMRKRRVHSGDRIVDDMKRMGFGNIELRKFYIPLSRTRDEVRAITDTMRILPYGITRDKVTRAIDEYYREKSWKIIHSDPYLIIGQK